MLRILKMGWSNMFSYGPDNELDFTRNAVTQIVGLNGSGKSNIPMILEEILFNKNSRGTKKSRILNRYVDSSKYSGYVVFQKDGKEYRVELVRGTSSVVKLFKDGEDISSHTATATYKDIENVIGEDFTLFSKKTYQGMTSSLKFLTDTDTNRKKFLISLLNLSEYAPYEQTLKEISSELNGELKALESSLKDLETWLNEANSVDRVIEDLVPVITIPENYDSEIQDLRVELKTIEQVKLAYDKYTKMNAEYESLLEFLNQEHTLEEHEDTEPLVKALSDNKLSVAPEKAVVSKLSKLAGKGACPTCEQSLNSEKITSILDKSYKIIEEAAKNEKELSQRISEAERAEKSNHAYREKIKEKQSRSKLLEGLLEDKPPEPTGDASSITARIEKIQQILSDMRKEKSAAEARNSQIDKHNAKVEEINSHIESISSKLDKTKSRLDNVSKERGIIQTLQKAFSTTGIVAYKLESMVKDLENLINEYLAEFSCGDFFLNFMLDGDKLNVIITVDGEQVSMSELSSGEQTRVNISTILAVRKIMNSLSNQSTNILILDELVSFIDAVGRPLMVDILLKEHDLNTFIISHGWSHPLVPRILVEKENRISNITYE